MTSWEIAVKDLVLLARDKQALALLLVLPLFLIAIIGMSTGQFLTGDENNERLKIIVVDTTGGQTSRNLIAELKTIPEFLITFAKNREDASLVLRRGDASLMLVVGPQFEDLVDELHMRDLFHMTDGTPENNLAALDLTVVANGKTGLVGRLLEGVLFGEVMKFIVPIAAKKNPLARSWMQANDDDDASSLTRKSVLAAGNSQPTENTVFQWVVPGFTVMFAYFLITIMARSFMTERDHGTLRRLMMAPVGNVSLLVGKTVPYFVTSVVQCSLLFLCGKVLFGMPWGAQPGYLIPVIVCTSAAAASLGLLLSTVVHTDQQISSYGMTLILVMSAVSGCFLPREQLPKLMQQIGMFTPHAWSLRGFDEVLNQPTVDPQVIAFSCGMLLVFAAVCSTAGWWRFGKACHA